MARLFAPAVVLVAVLSSLPSEARPDDSIDLVTVGHPGNDSDDETGYGAVPYEYQIGKYEITNAQYLQFLNAVAATDTYGLWGGPWFIGVQRTGAPGNYTYGPQNGDPAWLDRPVAFVNFWNACRFANWLHNHQPSGIQGPGTTETGSYTLDGYNGGDGRTITRNPGATWVIPTENEWYKAAYYDGGADIYYDYPTGTNVPPSNALMSPDPGNNANYNATSGFTIGPPYYVTPVGEFENSESPSGTFDQGGNVLEWNETVVSESRRGVRGGAYGFADIVAGPSGLLATLRLSEPPGNHDMNDGDLTIRVGYCDDSDLDGVSVCAGDCDGARATVYPGAAQLCDGLHNDCTAPDWPAVPANELDADGDGFTICQGDCDDTRATDHPGAPEFCNGRDDDCNGQSDEDAFGLDSDADEIHNACDNCRLTHNPSQLDSDSDLIGNPCDNCAQIVNPTQDDTDSDERGNACDNCPEEYNPLQDDSDADSFGNACDSCAFDSNPSQSDFDDDTEGDVCDFDDGLIYLYAGSPDYREWQAEAGFTTWNSYSGSLAVLRSTGVYTQAPGSNPAAARDCGLSDPGVIDDFVPSIGDPMFFLIAGVAAGVEGTLGADSSGATRPNSDPCP